MGGKNHVELDWAVDAITVGARHRQNLGDLDALGASIQAHGLLQPVTITPDGVLICGARRLAAIKQLGWRTVNVWVKADLSDRLTCLMAEREDQSTHKPYTVSEMAGLYEELKTVIAADAARRQQATRFGATPGPQNDSDGGGNFPPPALGAGKTREQAAAMVGGASHKTLDKVVAIRQIAADTTRPDTIRQQATQALQQIEEGAPVDPLYTRLRSAARLDDLGQIAADPSETDEARQAARSGIILLRKLEDTPMAAADLDKTARAALNRVKAARQQTTPAAPPVPPLVKPVVRTVKWFTWTWHELHDWTDQVDPLLVAAQVTETQWQQFCQTITASVKFMDTVTRLRQTTP